MTKAAVSKLKASLSEYLDKVKKGEEVVVTDRGFPVAKIIPFRPVGLQASERERLAREGIIELGRSGRAPQEFLKPSSVADPERLFLKALLKEREEGP